MRTSTDGTASPARPGPSGLAKFMMFLSGSGTGTGTGSGSTRVVEECQLMLRFALDKGKAVPEGLAAKISQLDDCLRRANLATIAEVPVQVYETAGAPARVDPLPAGAAALGETPPKANEAEPPVKFDFTATILFVHGQLSSLVAPATAQTLRVTNNRWGAKLFFNLPGVMQLAIISAFAFAVVFATHPPDVEFKPVADQPAAEKAAAEKAAAEKAAAASNTGVK